MGKTNAIAIVFDDHRLFADSFSELIKQLDFFNNVHTLTNKKELRNFLIKHSEIPIYLLLDYYLKNENCLALINEVKCLNRQVIIIIMGSTISSATVTNILDYKPQGVVSKSSEFNTFLQYMTAIAYGKRYIYPVISEIGGNMHNISKAQFTGRELEIFEYFAHRTSISKTAEKVHLSKNTIVAHRRNMKSRSIPLPSYYHMQTSRN